MPLDPDVKALLDETYGGPFTPLHEMSVDQARRQMLATSRMIGPPVEVAQVEDLEAPGPAGPIALRLYRPKLEGPLPVVVYFHGGGWTIGSIETHDHYCRSLANASGCAVLSVEYRLAPEHPFPAAWEDAYAATDWIATHAARLQIGAGKLHVAGDSAGGNLAATVALAARDRGVPAIKSQVLIYPITDCRVDTESYQRNADGYHLTRDTMIWFWKHYLKDPGDGEQPYASPLRAGDLSSLPPAMVITAEFDPLLDEGKAYARRLEQAGVQVAYRCYEGMIHGFTRRLDRIQSAHAALQDVADFLSRVSSEPA
jgi:acetyl esterase